MAGIINDGWKMSHADDEQEAPRVVYDWPDFSYLPKQDLGYSTRGQALQDLSALRVRIRTALIQAYRDRDCAREAATLETQTIFSARALRHFRRARTYTRQRVALIRALNYGG